MSFTDLPISFWGYALGAAARILNRSPSKAVEKTPYEMWNGRAPKLSFLKIWGCEAYVKRLQGDKLHPKSDNVSLWVIQKRQRSITSIIAKITKCLLLAMVSF